MTPIGRLTRYIRQWLAVRRLNNLVARQRDSYETRRYRERRAAALKGLAR